MDAEKLAYSVKELAALLNIGLSSAYGLTRRKGFPVIEVGKKKIIPKVALEKWLESGYASNQF